MIWPGKLLATPLQQCKWAAAAHSNSDRPVGFTNIDWSLGSSASYSFFKWFSTFSLFPLSPTRVTPPPQPGWQCAVHLKSNVFWSKSQNSYTKGRRRNGKYSEINFSSKVGPWAPKLSLLTKAETEMLSEGWSPFPPSGISSEISGKTEIKCSSGQLRSPEADGIVLHCLEAELVSVPLENIGMHPKKQCQPCHKQKHCHWRDDLPNWTKGLLFKHHWLLEGVKIFLLRNSLHKQSDLLKKNIHPRGETSDALKVQPNYRD